MRSLNLHLLLADRAANFIFICRFDLLMETLWSKTSIVILLSRRVRSDNSDLSSSSLSDPNSHSISGLIATSVSWNFSFPAFEETSSFGVIFSRLPSGVSGATNSSFSLTSMTVAEGESLSFKFFFSSILLMPEKI